MSGFGSIVVGSGLASSNPYAGTADTYSSLPSASSKDQQVWLVINSEGIKWIPVLLGWTYYPSGYYWSNGGVWDYIGELPYQALQVDVDAGIIPDQFVSPLTLNNYSRWDTKKNDSMTTNKLLGRGTVGIWAIEEITLGTNLSLTGNILNATGGGGTVTNVSSATAELTVATPTTTPVITIVSAPKLTTARNINGVAFDGTGNITVADATKQPLDAGLTSISALTGAGYVKATATDTFSQVSAIPQADVTNLTTDLAGKQATLVSGTNIRTVNGNTLLGSTDIIVTGTTNLSYTPSATNGIVVSDTGTDATIPLGNGTNAGLSLNDYTTAEKTKLSGIATGATANLSDATLLNRANHTSTQLSSTISDFTEASQDAVGAMVDTSIVYVDATPLLTRAALTGAIIASQWSNTTTLGSFTTAQLNTAISDNDIATGGGTATGTNTGDNAVNSLYSGLVSNATHTGDATGSTALTLATVNSNVGSFGLADSVAQFVVNAKGLITSTANTAIAIASTAITDFASASRAQTEAELVAGSNITITPSGTGATRQLTIAGSGSSLTTKDEGTTLSTAVTTLNFIGTWVTASGTGATTTINIPWSVVEVERFVDSTPDNGSYGLLSWVVNGVNTLFTVSQWKYLTGKLIVSLNGQIQTQGTSNDWQETSFALWTFTFNVAPAIGAVVMAEYSTNSVAGTIIDDQNSSTTTTYSSSKINNLITNTFEHLLINGKTNGVEINITGWTYLVYTYNGNTIYRFLSTALDSNGYNVMEAFYGTLTSGVLSDLIVARG